MKRLNLSNLSAEQRRERKRKQGGKRVAGHRKLRRALLRKSYPVRRDGGDVWVKRLSRKELLTLVQQKVLEQWQVALIRLSRYWVRVTRRCSLWQSQLTSSESC